MIQLKKFPLPPPSNQLYSNISRYRRCKSKRYLDYEKECKAWTIKNQEQLSKARDLLCLLPKKNAALFSHKHFYQRRILSKDGSVIKNDTSNRLKALEDVLSNILMIDDKYFWSGSYDKSPVTNKDQEGVDIEISIIDVKT